MKRNKILSLVFVIALVFVWVMPVAAQDLGDTDKSVIIIQNVSSNAAVVTLTFFGNGCPAAGCVPSDLGGGITNGFTLAVGASKVIDVALIPAGSPPNGLPSGKFSVLISSTYPVVAVAEVFGSGTKQFSGGYGSVSSGATTMYLPGFYYNFGTVPWFSMITIQNIGSGPATGSISINCENGTTGSLDFTNIPQYASKTWKLKDVADRPSGWTGTTVCVGSATVTSDQPVVGTDNNNIPSLGNTLSSLGFPLGSGSSTIYAPAVYKNFGCSASGCWQSGFVIRKIEAGTTTATITYSDGQQSTCSLNDTASGVFCRKYTPSDHATNGRFSVTVTTSPPKQLIGLVNIAYVNAGGTSAPLSIAYNALVSATATGTVFLPVTYKNYFNWITGIVCQNVGTINTDIRISFEGYAANAHNFGTVLSPGQYGNFFLQQGNAGDEAYLPAGYNGSAKVTAVTSGGQIACIAQMSNLNFTQVGFPGDWSFNYNGLNQ